MTQNTHCLVIPACTLYSNRAVTYNQLAVTALFEYFDLHACFRRLQVAIAAGDHPSSNLRCYSGGFLLLQWAATAKSILAVQPSFAAIQRRLSLMNLGFT